MVAKRQDDIQPEEATVSRHEAVGGPCFVVRCSHGEIIERPLPTEAARLSDDDILFRALVRHYGTIGCPCARHLWERLTAEQERRATQEPAPPIDLAQRYPTNSRMSMPPPQRSET